MPVVTFATTKFRVLDSRIRSLQATHNHLEPVLQKLYFMLCRHNRRHSVENLINQSLIALERLGSQGIVDTNNSYPPPQTLGDLKRLIDFEQFTASLQKDFVPESRKLSVISTDKCNFACVHCHSSFRPKGKVLDFSQLEKADPRFFKQFDQVTFGVAGDPLRSASKNQAGEKVNLSDYVAFFYQQGIKRFTILTRGAKVNDTFARHAFLQTIEFLKNHPDAQLLLRTSFNLFAPLGFNQEQQDYTELEKEFLFALLPALGRQNIIIEIGLVGSFKRSKGHINETADLLRKIMGEHGFVEDTFIQYLRHWVLCHPDNVDKIIFDAAKNSSVSNFEFFKMLSRQEPLPTFTIQGQGAIGKYYHLETGQEIEIALQPTFQSGRYKKLISSGRGGEIITPEIDILYLGTKSIQDVCDLFTTQSLTLNPDGSLDMCSFFLKDSRPRFGHISEPFETLEQRYRRRIERAREACQRNLSAIMQGNYSCWFCQHPEWTSGE